MDTEDSLVCAWNRQVKATDRGDAAALRDCCTPYMRLTHMTGHVRPLDERLDGVRTRQFVHHRMEEHSTHSTVESPHDGSGRARDLRMEQEHRDDGDGTWLCTASRVRPA